jgi:hypothetical protein
MIAKPRYKDDYQRALKRYQEAAERTAMTSSKDAKSKGGK